MRIEDLLSFSAPRVSPADIPATLSELQAIARDGPQAVIDFLSDAGISAEDCRNISAAIEAVLPDIPTSPKVEPTRLTRSAPQWDDDDAFDVPVAVNAARKRGQHEQLEEEEK